MFLEQDVDNVLGDRYNRWWTAYGGGGSVTLPLVMVDSGQQISNGYVDFYNTYKAMVDAELARPPQAEIVVHSERISDTLHFEIQLTNLSGVPLSYSSNRATVHAIVYEDAHVGTTDRIVRAAVSTAIDTTLAHGETMTFTLQTELSGVNWDNIHPLVLADYRPGGTSGAYDVLQAALASAQTFSVEPASLTFMVAPGDPSSPSVPMVLEGASSLNWTALTSTPWLTITPTSGPIALQPIVSVLTGALSSGWQQGHITFTASNNGEPQFSQGVPVNAYYGSVERVYLPIVIR